MITDLILGIFAGWIKDAISGFPAFDASGWPSMPPAVVDFLVPFGLVFGPGILVVLVWRVIAYFLPGGAG